MPIFKWEDIEETMITPGYAITKGKSILGNMLLLQRVEYQEGVTQGKSRADGKVGANIHYHPEEQLFIVCEGKVSERFGGRYTPAGESTTHLDPAAVDVSTSAWLSGAPGDVVCKPAYTLHETCWEGYGLAYSVKARIPGHSWYDQSWQPGAREAWEKYAENFRVMNEKFRETIPWDKVCRVTEGTIINWDEIEETMITPGYSIARGKSILGNMLLLQRVEFRQDVTQIRRDGQAGANFHYHPEEQMFIILQGTMNVRFGGTAENVAGETTHFDLNKMKVPVADSEWQSAGPGSVCHIPAYTLHEAYFDGHGLTYSAKARIPGHSWYDESWQPGAREAWEAHFKNFKEMNNRFKETLPWDR